MILRLCLSEAFVTSEFVILLSFYIYCFTLINLNYAFQWLLYPVIEEKLLSAFLKCMCLPKKVAPKRNFMKIGKVFLTFHLLAGDPIILLQRI